MTTTFDKINQTLDADMNEKKAEDSVPPAGDVEVLERRALDWWADIEYSRDDVAGIYNRAVEAARVHVSRLQAECDDALFKLAEHIVAVEKERDELQAEVTKANRVLGGLRGSCKALAKDQKSTVNNLKTVQAALNSVTAERDGLKAEVKQLKYHLRTAHGTIDVVDKQRGHWMDKYHALKSELTKARELLTYAATTLREPLVVGWEDDLAVKIEQLLAHQSAPVAKNNQLESDAEALYNTWEGQEGWTPWVVRGNSIMQDKARQIARKRMAPAAKGECDE